MNKLNYLIGFHCVNIILQKLLEFKVSSDLSLLCRNLSSSILSKDLQYRQLGHGPAGFPPIRCPVFVASDSGFARATPKYYPVLKCNNNFYNDVKKLDSFITKKNLDSEFNFFQGVTMKKN